MDGLIGSARLYEWSPGLGTAWGELLRWVSETAGVAYEVIPRDVPMGLDELRARGDMGCVAMCGYPWALAAEPPWLDDSTKPATPEQVPLTTRYMILSRSTFRAAARPDSELPPTA